MTSYLVVGFPHFLATLILVTFQEPSVPQHEVHAAFRMPCFSSMFYLFHLNLLLFYHFQIVHSQIRCNWTVLHSSLPGWGTTSALSLKPACLILKDNFKLWEQEDKNKGKFKLICMGSLCSFQKNVCNGGIETLSPCPGFILNKCQKNNTYTHTHT
jgi:hypothetical protein